MVSLLNTIHTVVAIAQQSDLHNYDFQMGKLFIMHFYFFFIHTIVNDKYKQIMHAFQHITNGQKPGVSLPLNQIGQISSNQFVCITLFMTIHC